MASEVKIIIEADDQASGVLKDVNSELDVLTNQAKAEAFQMLGQAGRAAFDVIAGAASQWVEEAAEVELIQARLIAQLETMGSEAPVTAGEISELATQLAKISGFDDDAIVQGQATLLRFGNLTEDQFNRASEAAVGLAALTGMDLVSAFRQVGVALENPAQGFGRLKRQVGDLNEEEKIALQQALAMNDTLKAQEIILGALERKTEGAAESIGKTWTMTLERARNENENFRTSIADGLLPVLEAVPQPLLDAAVGIFDMSGQIVILTESILQMAMALKVLRGAQVGGAVASAAGTAAGIGATAAPAAVTTGAAAAGIGAGAVALPLLIGAGAATGGLVVGLKVEESEMKRAGSALAAAFLVGIPGIGTLLSMVSGGFSLGQSLQLANGNQAAAPEVTINYSPGISMGNQAEFENVLVPIIEQTLRKITRGWGTGAP